ncbi:lycopene cyclase family protein [Sphingobacterium bambusae]|uniref:Lycopene cyclase family protein n=1 Tax=Sphingobacterium bambusae TaxID=662858 RepID=A0ABW6BGN8_9SPHI|nr:lycopene cyclase family protein [Sphingobacterium bambusae]WPL49497.1 lycopene cyclase family protein [Sphingobacterium bambusae]
MNKNQENHYDIIFAGFGISGSCLLYEAMQNGIWKDQRILVIDHKFGDRGSKLISFWADRSTPLKKYAVANWKRLAFISHIGKKKQLEIGDYEYFSIASDQLLETYHQYIYQFSNITFVEGKILDCISDETQCIIDTEEGRFTASYVFNSLFFKPDVSDKHHYFLQHFKGVQITLSKPISNEDEAIIMDYRTDQKHGTTFFYCLPMSEKKLFVEYTLFSKSLIPVDEYDDAIKSYLSRVLQISDYTIESEEQGIIPMTDHNFPRRKKNIIYIGSAGGDTRPSTGYTFMNVQKTVHTIISSFQQTGKPFFKNEVIGTKEKLYDSILLSVLDERNYPGHEIFTDLFQNTPAKNIFKFLDAESSLKNDVKVMTTLRKPPFIKHFVKILYRNLSKPY